jgi:hypothetical protein
LIGFGALVPVPVPVLVFVFVVSEVVLRVDRLAVVFP